MKLYRVSFDLSQPLERTFIPLIPDSAGYMEDKTIKRVCLSSSIEGCLQAIPRNKIDISVGTEIIVYEAEIDENDYDLVYPDEIRDYVPDALENDEFWYTKDLYMTGYVAKIKDIKSNYELAFTAVDEDDFICNMLDVIADKGYKYLEEISEIMMDEELSLEDRYYESSDILYNAREYSLQDEIFDSVAQVSWAQALKIKNLELSRI